MTHLPGRLAGALVLCVATAPACAGPGVARAPEPTPAASSDLSRLEALYRARTESALERVHPADVDFMAGMIGHHAQALVMSAWAPTHGAGASVQTLAARIINAQKDDIAFMQRWLRDRGQMVAEVGAGGHMHHSAHMPGMLTQAQLDELEAARGADFERLFLTYMIQHHQGAITMVHDLFAIDGAAQDESVFKLASDIQVDQTTEVARMQQMLEAMAGPSNR